MVMMQIPTARVLVMVVITISNGGGADTDSECGDDSGDHYPQ